jgi:hypothetical protein
MVTIKLRDSLKWHDGAPVVAREMLRADPNWNGSDYYATGVVVDTLTDLRENTLRICGI